MTDITESDIKIIYIWESDDEDERANSVVIDCKDGKEADEIKQQILQNQKDAQEYRKIKEPFVLMVEELKIKQSIILDLHKALETHAQQVRDERAKHQILWNDFQDLANENNRIKESCSKLQSQHKKLVDAIQTQIESSAKIELSTHQAVLTEKEHRKILQNLLKESEK